jgi:hypothetical protein
MLDSIVTNLVNDSSLRFGNFIPVFIRTSHMTYPEPVSSVLNPHALIFNIL